MRRTEARPARGQKTKEALARFHEEAAIVETYDLQSLLRIWAFVRPHARPLVVSMILLVTLSAFALARPLVIRAGLDAMEGPGGLDALARAGVLLVVLLVVEQTLAFPQVYLMQRGGARAMADLRHHVFEFLHTRRLAFFDNRPIGRLVTRVTGDVDAVNEAFSSGALNAIGDLIRLAAIVVILVSLDPELSLIAFAAVPPIALGVNWTRKRMRAAYRQVRAKTAQLNAFLNEQVAGMAVVQAYAQEESALEEFDAINTAYRDANQRSIVLDATLDATIEMVSSVCIALVLWYVGFSKLAPDVSFGTLFAFIVYIEMFFVPIRDLSARYTQMQSAMAGAERIFELLDNQEEDAPVPEAGDARVPRPEGAPAFELDAVDFGYKPTAKVLHEVSIAARPGEKVALVGATGAGKSTVASLLLRLYEVDAGAVRVFGEDVRRIPRDELRRLFAVVPQDVYLFPGTVASNIGAGDAKPDMGRIRWALTRVGALPIFERREGGLDAPVLERGQNFSAGERQLIAFARALYLDAPILVLDEATATVDSDTEARLSRAVDVAMEGRTALVIAHRLSTIRRADRIVVFAGGRVVEEGRHEDLLARGGVYARLHRLQFGAEAQAQSEGPHAGTSSSAS